MKEKVILAYSGGLDTTTIIPWLKENFGYEVICCCIDCGQGNELDGLDERAKLSGASKLYIEDLVDDFCDNYIVRCVQANSIYENKYLLGTAMARPAIAKKLVEIANRLNLPEGTVRRWKCTHKWDSERSDKNSERSDKKKVKKKKAAGSEVDQVIENPELTDKQRLFCVYYIRSFNATKAYQKAYEVDYLTAAANGPRMLGNARVKKEILQLKQERLNREFLSESDIFQKYMDIAFADITDYLEFGTEEVPVMAIYGPVKTKDPETGEEKPLTKIVNTVRFKDSSEVDGTILAEVKQGRDGASIKLSDRMKALQWLSDNMKLGTEQQLARLEQQRAQIDLLRARKQDLTGENESQEAVEKLDQILKELRENAVKQQTE